MEVTESEMFKKMFALFQPEASMDDWRVIFSLS